MEFSPDQPLEQALDTYHACAYLGVTPLTLLRLREAHLIQAHYIDSERKQRKQWRYPVASLHEYQKKHQPKQKLWDPKKPEMPVIVVARLLGIAESGVLAARYQGRLKSYRPADVREYLLRRQRRNDEGLAEVKKYYQKKIETLRASNQTLARKLSNMLCAQCEKNPVRKNYPAQQNRGREPLLEPLEPKEFPQE